MANPPVANPWRWSDTFATAEAAEQRLKDLTSMRHINARPLLVELARKGVSTQLVLGKPYTDRRGHADVIPYGITNLDDGPNIISQNMVTRRTSVLGLTEFTDRYQERTE